MAGFRVVLSLALTLLVGHALSCGGTTRKGGGGGEAGRAGSSSQNEACRAMDARSDGTQCGGVPGAGGGTPGGGANASTGVALGTRVPVRS